MYDFLVNIGKLLWYINHNTSLDNELEYYEIGFRGSMAMLFTLLILMVTILITLIVDKFYRKKQKEEKEDERHS